MAPKKKVEVPEIEIEVEEIEVIEAIEENEPSKLIILTSTLPYLQILGHLFIGTRLEIEDRVEADILLRYEQISEIEE